MFMCLFKPEARKQSSREQCGFKRRAAELGQRAVQQKERLQGRGVEFTIAKQLHKPEYNQMPVSLVHEAVLSGTESGAISRSRSPNSSSKSLLLSKNSQKKLTKNY